MVVVIALFMRSDHPAPCAFDPDANGGSAAPDASDGAADHSAGDPAAPAAFLVLPLLLNLRLIFCFSHTSNSRHHRSPTDILSS